ncbi:hypothetical protein T05_7982, partial [Trichinella murrelli]
LNVHFLTGCSKKKTLNNAGTVISNWARYFLRHVRDVISTKVH